MTAVEQSWDRILRVLLCLEDVKLSVFQKLFIDEIKVCNSWRSFLLTF